MFKWIWNEELECFCALHNPTIRADKNGNVFGGGGDSPPAPAPPPPPPTATQSAAEYAAAMPQIYETQLEYMPKFAMMSKAIAEQTYPLTSALQESLAGQAARGMVGEGVPDWMRKEYLSGVRAQLGEQAAAPIGAATVSRGLMQQAEDWRRYYRQLGLSLAGRQQLVQPPSYREATGGFTPASVMQQQAATYAPYAAAMTQGNIAQYQMAMQPSPWGQMAGQAVGGFTSALPLAIM